MKTLKESIEKHFKTYPMYVDNYVGNLVCNDNAQKAFDHYREGDFLRGYEAAIKSVVEFLEKEWQLSEERAGSMIVGLLKKLNTDEYFVNHSLYHKFEKYVDGPLHKPYDLFTSPYNATKFYIVSGVDRSAKEYIFLEITNSATGGSAVSKRMDFKKFENMVARNDNSECNGV
ncbi:hypothetical protein [Pseudobutyrivibrio sp.]|uniref:hypothetical protein n=1 Tax=Pseudobutyrivibrio sp. TaxID=2014367 RepID=UPI003869878F